MSFKSGDAVQCVDASNTGRPAMLRQGCFYEIDYAWGDYVFVKGVRPLRPGFWQRRFVHVPRADLWVFRAMLEPTDAQPAGDKVPA